MGHRRSSLRRRFIFVALLLLGSGSVAGWFYHRATSPRVTAEEALVEEIVESENLVLFLQRDLDQLSKSALNLSLPDWKTVDKFAPKVRIQELANEPQSSPTSGPLSYSRQTWPVQNGSSEQPSSDLALLSPLFDTLDYFKHFKLKLVKGHFSDEARNLFIGNVAVSGLAYKGQNNSWLSIDGELILQWRRHDEEACESSNWLISDWLLLELTVVEDHASPLFREVIDSVIPSESERRQAQRSVHEELAIELIKTGNATLPVQRYNHEFQYESAGSHPGIAVADIDQNGWDDLYVMSRWGKNQLFLNQGDGTFSEGAADYCLDIDSHCTCAVFADFDNDGDPDLFLGRCFERSMYLANENGIFVDLSDLNVSTPLTGMVSSVSAADYNGDGLLDVYFSTYGNKRSLVQQFLTNKQLEELDLKLKSGSSHHKFLNGVGAPNQLLVNKGHGKFARAPEADQLEGWQTTFQATWADYDKDGDPDLYIANDFGPDRLMRNDYPNGFTDVTEQDGHETMQGFGMGAAWGDYDLDGRQDLYVSNMYSKAGMRITGQVPGLDNRFRSFANGNRLYRQSEQGFEYTSGLEAPKMLVAKAGWSWGGQFADFDNDGYLDIYVASGYFTAPPEVAVQDDL